MHIVNSLFGRVQQATTCRTCGGDGKVADKKCTKCGGKGVVREKQSIKLKIPAQ